MRHTGHMKVREMKDCAREVKKEQLVKEEEKAVPKESILIRRDFSTM